MAKLRIIRIVLDTNWYVSAVLSRKSRRVLYQILTDKRLCILATGRLEAEFWEVISREKFRKIISMNQVKRFMSLVLPRLEYVNSTSITIGSRDAKDNYLLALSRDGKANYLVSGDLDLLVLGQFEGTTILKMADFLALVQVQ